MRFATLAAQRSPPAPSTGSHSSTSLSDAPSLTSLAFTPMSGTSASSASANSPNSPLAPPTNPSLAQLKKTYRDLCSESRIVQSTPEDDNDAQSTSRVGVPSIVEPQSGEDVWLLTSAPTPSPPTLVSATLAAPMPSAPLDLSPTLSVGLQAAAELEQEDERDVWRSRARDWYGLGLKDAPGTGKLHHHLGLLCRDDPGYELRAAYHFRQDVPGCAQPMQARGGLAQRGGRASTGNANKDRDVEMEDAAADDAEDLARPMQALSTSAPTADDELPHHFTLAVRLFCAALRFTLRQPKIRATPPYGPQYNPSLTVALTFLANLVRTPTVCSAIERHVPWARLTVFSGYIVRRRAAGAEVSVGAKGRFVLNLAGPLPEDWCIRGTEWVCRVYPHGFWRAGRWSGEGDVLDAATVRDGVVEDGDDAENGAEEDGAAVLERGGCARLGAAVGGIVEHVEGMRWQEDATSRSKAEEEEERERRKKWSVRSRWDMDVDEVETEEVEPEDDEDDVDEDEEIRALKARRRELRARTSQTSPRRRPARPARSPAMSTPARSTPRLAPRYTVLVLDTNIFLSALPAVSQLVSSQRWTVVVPLAVVTELDGLARQSAGAQRAVSFLEAQVRAGQSVGLGLKIQTSRGNYLPSLAVRSKQFGGHGGGMNGAGGWERNMDDFILKSALWQAENFVDRSAFLEGGAAVEMADAKPQRAYPRASQLTNSRDEIYGDSAKVRAEPRGATGSAAGG
ncbi:hypothetical protein FS749_016614 [Ceratobasidium sp. UAMH 11750]|nr:hypothetical protein FS749_016614 [Ceratobasidium sp. UAMH 11750]